MPRHAPCTCHSQISVTGTGSRRVSAIARPPQRECRSLSGTDGRHACCFQQSEPCQTLVQGVGSILAGASARPTSTMKPVQTEPVPAESGSARAPDGPARAQRGRRGAPARGGARHAAHLGPALRHRALRAHPGPAPPLLARGRRPAGADAARPGPRRLAGRRGAVRHRRPLAEPRRRAAAGPPAADRRSGRRPRIAGDRAARSGLGGVALRLPGAGRRAHGLARAALELDPSPVRALLDESVAAVGVERDLGRRRPPGAHGDRRALGGTPAPGWRSSTCSASA